ncbi:MAG: uroporphyrinogen decarboxylase family protein [Clostridia bacterium]|nr:uroporphyrinogen decarboxylase family protein [Clostridia bacterium]
MKRNMRQFVAETIAAPMKKPAPVLSYPASQLMGVTVRQLVSDPELQTETIRLVAQRVPTSVAVSLMDLSVEAEAFGAQIVYNRDEVPSVTGRLVASADDLASLRTPEVGDGRTGICVKGVADAAEAISDRPLLAGVIGPYSLAGRLTDVTEIMMLCYDDPDLARGVLERATDFIIRYALAFREAGANGVIMAEPLTGMLSPALAEEFSAPFVRRVIDEVQTDEFAVCYHNCGNNTVQMADSIASLGAMMYHFGDAIRLADILPLMPSDALVMGNVSAAGQFLRGTPESVRKETLRIIGECAAYPNFVPSSGCDVPPASGWDNIEAFFAACSEFYAKRA